MSDTTRSNAESPSAGRVLAASARKIRADVVRMDLVCDGLQRSEAGLSRAEVVTLLADLDGIASTLSEVAGTIEHVAP